MEGAEVKDVRFAQSRVPKDCSSLAVPLLEFVEVVHHALVALPVVRACRWRMLQDAEVRACQYTDPKKRRPEVFCLLLGVVVLFLGHDRLFSRHDKAPFRA